MVGKGVVSTIVREGKVVVSSGVEGVIPKREFFRDLHHEKQIVSIVKNKLKLALKNYIFIAWDLNNDLRDD